MKNIDVLNGKIEEVRKGNNPCSNATFDKTNGIVGSQFTNGYEVEEDRESLKNVCGNKRVSTEISSDEATAAKNNKDGCPNPYNSSKAAATTASTVNRPNDSTSSCTKNGISSGQKDTNNATGVSTTPSQEKIYKSENCKESNKFRMGNMSSTASEKAGNESGQKVEELISSENRSASKVGKEFSTKKVGSNSTQVVMLNGSNDSKNVSDSILKNDKDLTEKTESQLPGKNSPTNEGSNELKKSDSVKIVASSGKELHTSKEIGVPKMQESVQETSFDDESKTNEKISKPDVADSKKEQGEQKVIGEKKIQEDGKKTSPNDDSKKNEKSISKPDVADSNRKRDDQKGMGEKKIQDGKKTLPIDDSKKNEKSISKSDVADSKKDQNGTGKKKIYEEGRKTVPNDDSKKNEKSILKSDVADSKKEQEEQKAMGEKKIQELGKKTLPSDDSKKNEKISKPNVADSNKKRDEQKEMREKKIQEVVKQAVSKDDTKKSEKSISKSNMEDSKKEQEEQKAMGEKKIQELGKKTLPSDDSKKNEKISKPDVADSNKKRDEQKEMREKKIQEVVKQAVPKDDTKKNEKSISKSNMEDSKKEQEEQKAMGEKKIQELGKKTLPSDDSKKNEKISKPNVADSNKKRDEQKGMGEKKIQELGKKTLPNDSKKNEKSISKSDVADSAKEQEQKAMGEKKVQELGKKTLLNDTSKSNENPILKPDKPKETGRKESQKFENKTSPNVSSKATEESTISKTKAVAETLTRKKQGQPNESEVQKSQEPEKNNSCNITSITTGESSLKSEVKTRTVTEKKDKQNGNDVKNTQQSEKISIDDDSRKSDKSNLKSGVTVTGNHKSKEKEAENTKEFEKKTSSSVEPKLTGKPTVKSDATVSKTELCEPIIDIEITQKSEKKIPSNDDSKKDEKSDLKPGGGHLADSKNIEETSKEIGIKKTQDSGKDSTLSDDLKKDDKSILKPETVIETISATRLDQNKSEDNKIQLSENKTSLNDASKTIEKSILMSDVDKPATRVEQDNTKESEETKTEESVDNILANDKVAASNENGSTLKSDKVEDDINSADNSTSQDDKLNKKLEKTLPNQDKLDKDEEKVASVPETYKESKKIDDSSSKTDEIEKTDIQEKLSDGPEKIEDSVSKKSSIDGEVTSPEETVTENVGLMQVDSIGTVETCEKVEIGAVELAAKEDSESKQDRDIESTVTPEASEGKEALQEIVESSDKSDVQAVSSSTECPKIGQKRPAEFEEDSVKRLKTDDCSSPTVDNDCPKKRVCPSPDDNDAGTELKRKRTESIHGDNNSSDTSKSNVKSDSINSEKSSKLNIKDSNIEPEESPKLDVDNDSEVESSLDLEYKADSPDPISRTSSVSDVNEAKSSILTRLLSSDVGDDSNISISDDSLPSTKVRSLCGSASPNRDDMESESAAPGNEEEESSSVVLLKETLKRMKKSDLEKLVMLKVSESLSYKSEIGDLRTKYHAAKESIDRWRKRCNFFEKIKTELSMTMSKYLREVEACKNSEKGMEFSIPMKFTRSVGLQVSVPIGHQKRHHDVRVHQQKSKPELSEIQQKYIQQQQQVHEQQQLQQKQQQQKEQQNVLKDQESSQTSSTKTAVPKVTTNVRSSTPRRLASSRPTQAAEPNSKVNQVFPVSSTSQKLPLRSGAATSSTAAVTTSAALPTTATASLAQSGSSPVPVAITASKIASPSTSSASLEVIDLTEKDDRSRVCQDTQKNASPPVSFAVVKQFVSPGKSTIAGNPANGQRTYLVPTSAVAGNSRQLLIATTAGINQIPIATAVMTSSGRNNAVTLPANAVIVKNGVLQSAAPNVVVRSNAIVQRPVQSVKPTQSASHPAPLPPCPPAIHENGWRLAPPRPQLVVRKTPSGTGIMLSWTLSLNKSFEDIASYQLYAYQEGTSPPSSSLWKKVGDVKALPLPMACTLTQFVEGHKYHFAVRAVDIHSRVGHFSGPSTITLN